MMKQTAPTETEILRVFVMDDFCEEEAATSSSSWPFWSMVRIMVGLGSTITPARGFESDRRQTQACEKRTSLVLLSPNRERRLFQRNAGRRFNECALEDDRMMTMTSWTRIVAKLYPYLVSCLTPMKHSGQPPLMSIKRPKSIMTNRAYIVVTLCLLLLSGSTHAKTTSGKFRLSGLNTEHVLGSFAISEKKVGHMKVVFKSKEPYQLNKDLFVRLYRDDQWTSYNKAPSCTDKVPFSIKNEPVTTHKVKGHYEAEVTMELNNHKEDRPHFYYFVITDCSLEFYMHDDQIPQMSHELTAWNDGSHVSADESHLYNLHTVTLLLSGILALLLGVTVVIQIYEKHAVHAAVFLVMLAASCDSFSSMFELIHLSIYARNGIGSYWMDAVSAHLEAICDSVVALLLLSVAAGWTLPSDVVKVQQNATPLQKMLGGLRSPFVALRSFTTTAVLAVSILLSHVVLAQWGRMYNDDFDSYHDLEHLPGKLLMLWRIVLGLGMLGCCFSTRMRCPASLQRFYLQLAFVGTMWFQSLPVLTWVVNTMLPYHLRHRTIGIWGATLQTSAILLLSWLVTSHSTAYHRLSHMSAADDNLTDTLASSGGSEESRTWMFGKAKVRLD
jgi:hypothetical protein